MPVYLAVIQVSITIMFCVCTHIHTDAHRHTHAHTARLDGWRIRPAVPEFVAYSPAQKGWMAGPSMFGMCAHTHAHCRVRKARALWNEDFRILNVSGPYADSIYGTCVRVPVRRCVCVCVGVCVCVCVCVCARLWHTPSQACRAGSVA